MLNLWRSGYTPKLSDLQAICRSNRVAIQLVREVSDLTHRLANKLAPTVPGDAWTDVDVKRDASPLATRGSAPPPIARNRKARRTGLFSIAQLIFSA